MRVVAGAERNEHRFHGRQRPLYLSSKNDRVQESEGNYARRYVCYLTCIPPSPDLRSTNELPSGGNWIWRLVILHLASFIFLSQTLSIISMS